MVPAVPTTVGLLWDSIRDGVLVTPVDVPAPTLRLSDQTAAHLLVFVPKLYVESLNGVMCFTNVWLAPNVTSTRRSAPPLYLLYIDIPLLTSYLIAGLFPLDGENLISKADEEFPSVR